MEWVKVSDRLPDEDEDVITYNGWYVHTATYNGGFYEHNLGCDGDSALVNNVTHWMPLSSPPTIEATS